MRIIVCDDEVTTCEEVEQKLLKFTMSFPLHKVCCVLK